MSLKQVADNAPIGKKDLGKNRDGFQIVARGCGEDNSGHVFYNPELELYTAKFTYPIDCDYNPQTEKEKLIFHKHFTKQEEAVKFLHDNLGLYPDW